MRILASNPDGIGDLVLRQPMYAALREAGHELRLLVRRDWETLVPHLAPGVSTHLIPGDPYSLAVRPQWDALEPLFAQARTFDPDLLLVAPFQWTLLEERLATECPRARVAGMRGHIYAGDVRWGV